MLFMQYMVCKFDSCFHLRSPQKISLTCSCPEPPCADPPGQSSPSSLPPPSSHSQLWTSFHPEAEHLCSVKRADSKISASRLCGVRIKNRTFRAIRFLQAFKSSLAYLSVWNSTMMNLQLFKKLEALNIGVKCKSRCARRWLIGIHADFSETVCSLLHSSTLTRMTCNCLPGSEL